MKLASHIRHDGATVAVVTDAGLVPLTDLSADVRGDMRPVLAWLDLCRPDLHPEEARMVRGADLPDPGVSRDSRACEHRPIRAHPH